MNLFKAMATVGGLTGVSRIAGFVRDILTAAILGAGPVADAFFVALKLPNFFRRVTAEGAFSVSFVPVYGEKLERDGRAEADSFALNMFYIMSFWLGGLTLIAMWLMPWIIYAVAPGFSDDPVRYDLAVALSRITFPYLLFMSLTALLGGVLNALNKFAPFAFAPVLFNLSLIAALLSSSLFQTAGHAMAWGVLAAGILQLLYLCVSAMRSGFTFRMMRPKIDADVRKVLRLMGPGVIGAGVMHINLFADLILASFLSAGSISYLYYADRLNQLPLGVVGIAVGTALLPMLSRAIARQDHTEGCRLFNRALEFCLLLALPAAAALAVMPDMLIGVLFERGAFTAEDTHISALVLMCYACGLPAYIATKVFSTAHWARQDTVTPVKISVVATIMNIALSIGFIQVIGVAGIALGTGLTGWVQFFAHIRALKGHPAAQFDARFKRTWPRIVFSSVLMAALLYAGQRVLEQNVVSLALLVTGGLLVYGLSSLATGAIKPEDLKKYLKRP